MNPTELKELIATAADINWFNQRVDKIDYHFIDYKPEFTSVSALFEYTVNQIEGWEKHGEFLPDSLKNCKIPFTELKSVIENFVVNQINTESEGLTGYWVGQIFPQIDKVRYSFPYDGIETTFLLEVNKEQPNYFQGAYQFFVGFAQNIATNKDNFTGAILAYEVSSKGKSIIAERSKTEEKSIEVLKNNFQKYIGETEQHLTEKLRDTNTKYKVFAEGIENYKTDKEAEVTNWFNTSKSTFKTFDEEANAKIKTLEDLYRDKLSLEAPVEYWNKRAIELKSEGNKWLCYLIICSAIGIVLLFTLLTIIANNEFEEIFQFSGKTIRWSVIFVTMISFMAFLIRTFTKLTFSTFHLVRDAEERKQLTYVYLALKENNAVTDADRHIVLQSLFSRADTGLLKEDSSPTMPASIMDKVTNSAK